MTQRLKGCYVAFEKDIREDDAESILQSIRMIRGVGGVTTDEAGLADYAIRTQVRCELSNKLQDLLKEVLRF